MKAGMYFVHSFNPVFLEFGPITIYYYGMLFALLFIASFLLGRFYFQQKGIDEKYLEKSFLIAAVSVVIGARLGHVIFYNLPYFLKHPLEILYIWQGGLASHGAVIGLIVSILLISRYTKKPFFVISDIVSLCGSLAVFLVRMGNFINAEIVGRVTDVPWAVIFPCNEYIRGQCGVKPRHPSQLYESMLGLILFIILFFIVKRKHGYKSGFITGLFVTIYFSIRFFLEFFKEYDGTVLAPPLTNGQLLSIPLIITGIIVLYVTQLKAFMTKR